MMSVPPINSIVARACQIPGWMHVAELNWLYEQTHKLMIAPPGTQETDAYILPQILEIGCFKGRSAYVLCGSGANVTLVDHFRGADVELKDNQTCFSQFQSEEGRKLAVQELRVNLRPWDNWTLYQESAREYFGRSNLPTFDMIFLDGSHDEENVTHNIECGLKVLKPNGLLCGHDYGQRPGVTKAVKAALIDKRLIHVSRGEGTIWCCHPSGENNG